MHPFLRHNIIKVFVLLTIVSITILYACQPQEQLKVVNVSDFRDFILSTDYKTDAEKFGWSIIQEDIHSFRTTDGVNWKVPNAQDSALWDFPVTQVSYKDAIAYCQWAGVRLPNYEEYWTLAKKDQRHIHKNSSTSLPTEQVNIVGNVWDITMTEDTSENIRLAGGSYLCNESSCNGTNPKRKLFVDKTTGNIHIGFSIIK